MAVNPDGWPFQMAVKGSCTHACSASESEPPLLLLCISLPCRVQSRAYMPFVERRPKRDSTVQMSQRSSPFHRLRVSRLRIASHCPR